MKKIYLQPEVDVEEIIMEQMTATSVEMDEETIIDPSEADSRLLDTSTFSFD